MQRAERIRVPSVLCGRQPTDRPTGRPTAPRCALPAVHPQTLYTYPRGSRALKTMVAAQYVGADVKVAQNPPEFEFGVTNRQADFLARFPFGKVPAFVTADGKPIYESSAIAYYGACRRARGHPSPPPVACCWRARSRTGREEFHLSISYPCPKERDVRCRIAASMVLPGSLGASLRPLHCMCGEHRCESILTEPRCSPVSASPARPGAGRVTAHYAADACGYRRVVASSNRAAGLLGSTAYEEALVMQYLFVADTEVAPAVFTWVFPYLGLVPYNRQVEERAKDNLLNALAIFNGVLQSRTFFVGERITLADIALACALLPAFEKLLEPAVRAPYPHLVRWFTTVVNQRQFAAAAGPVALAESAPALPAASATASAEDAGGRKKEKKAKEARDAGAHGGDEGKKAKAEKKKQQQQQQQPKEEKPDAEAAEEADDYMDEEERAKSRKDPFAALLASPFNLDAFKRAYSNEDTATVAIPHFWQNFDKDGWSIWRCDYKYNNELSKIFMSCNLVTGMYQRIEKLRKYAFASMCVFGEDGNNSISGIWVLRGQDLAFNLSEDWQVDSPSYEWRKLDPASEADREMVNEFLLWSGKEFTERKFNQGKIFK